MKAKREKTGTVETHLDLMLKNAKDESLEEVFLKNKKIFLKEKLSWIQSEIDGRKIAQDIGFLLMVLYTFDFIEREVGRKYTNAILESLSFTGWPLELFKPVLDRDSFKEKVDLAVNINYKNLDPSLHSKTVELVSKIYRDLKLDKTFEDELEELVKEKKRLYGLIGSRVDIERREIVKKIAALKGKRIKLKLLNIGIVPTELCPNDCRFCLAAWKSGVKERIGKSLGEKEFRRMGDEVIDFAAKKNLIITITGGEPLLELDRVLYILSHAKTRVELSTSGEWAWSAERAEEILEEISDALKNNRNLGFSFGLQLSIDAFHQEVLRDKEGNLIENVPIKNLVNIIELTQKKFKDISICLIPKYTRYEDPVVRLLIGLRKRGLKGKLVKRHYDPELQVGMMDRNGKLIRRPALLKAYIGFTNEKEIQSKNPLFVLYSAVESIGKASILDSFEFHGFRERTEEFIQNKDSRERLPLIGFEISDDGNVYPGAHSLYSWSLGNLLDAKLEEIYTLAEHDPIFIAMEKNPVKIKNIAEEVEPDIIEKLKSASSPLVAIYKILEDQEMRLYITKRLIVEDPSYSKELKDRLGLSISVEKLKEEYLKRKRYG